MRDFTQLLLANETNKWIIFKGLKSSLLDTASGSDTKDPEKELTQPDINHTNPYVTGKASRLLHANDRTTQNVMTAASAIQRKVSIFCHHTD